VKRKMVAAIFLISCLLLTAAPYKAQESGRQQEQAVVGHAVRPARRDFSESFLNQLRVPAGFRVGVFARGLTNPRMMAVAPDGTVYVTDRDKGEVVALTDRDGDGRSDGTRIVVPNLARVHGITIHQNRLYLATIKEVYVADLKPDGTASAPRMLIRDLPDGGQHDNRTIAFGRDGMLYISVGSTCNDCEEPNKEHATILRAKSDGNARTIFARGLRNTIGWGWHPVTSEMWGMDHGSDWRGDDLPPEELNGIVEGSDYGWPYCYGERRVDPTRDNPKGTTKEAYCARTLPSTLTYQAHSAPIGMVFYTGSQFPPEYRNDAFVAMRGSWNRRPPTGYKVVRLRFKNGNPASFEDFLTGFLIEGGQAHFGRLAGLAVARDGSLLVADDSNGIIYRVSYGDGGRQ
jgi:glucose/arabinose dehydrogenase